MPSQTVTEFQEDRARLWRQEIVKARIKLADSNLSRTERSELWRIVDYREWCLKLTADNFTDELERIDREIEDELRRERHPARTKPYAIS